MARTRTVKPEFWQDEKLASVSRVSRLLFVGLWTCSDDYGVTRGHPTWLKNQIFPYDEMSISEFCELLDELENGGFISPFMHNGEKFYFIKNFQKHQKVDRPSKARNPLPPSELFPQHSRVSIECSRERIDETETETETEIYIIMFESFWSEYPRKVGKAVALKSFKRLGLNSSQFRAVLDALIRQKEKWARDKTELKFIPHASTWLNNRRWEDEVVDETKAVSSACSASAGFDAVAEHKRLKEEFESRRLCDAGH